MASFAVSTLDRAAKNWTEPRLTENARKVLEARYLKKNSSGDCVEQPAELYRRVARTIADVETAYGATPRERDFWERCFYDLMAIGDFMPNSPTLMNAGREMGMLSACFVLPVKDSIHEIFNSIKHTALIQKAGGGTGFAFDELRPTGDFIQSSGGTTSGPISFWRAFSEATNAIQQGAFRRGANMGMMYIHHPDILKFLHAKQDLSQFTNYNISVKVTDVWMEELRADPDSPHVVRNPRDGGAFVIPRDIDIWKSDIRNLLPVAAEPAPPRNGPANPAYYTTPRLTGPLPAGLPRVYTKGEVWRIIIKNAWQTGEPGVVFIDRINEANPTPHVGRIEATNPCGEQPLLPYEACNLGSINLGAFIKNACTPQAEVDWDRLRAVTHACTRFLDNVIDANNYPLPEIDRICKANRKIGLGIMGFADALYRLSVAYNSDEGVAWGERFMRFLNDEAHNYSEQLARERGPFPNWQGSHWQTRHNRLMRNSCATTVAPTGTISIIANCSGGIEPMFSLAFFRNVLKGQKQGEKPLVEVNQTFRETAQREGFYSDALIERLATEGTLAHVEGVPAEIRRVYVCAHDITPQWHMKMQAAFQRHCDSSISKTINFAHAASETDVEQIYRLAYDMRCKGVTVYRDGCRSSQPMALKESGKKGTEGRRELGIEGWRERGSRDDLIGQHAAPPRDVAGGSSSGGNGNGGDHGHGPALAQPPVAPRARLEPADLPEIVSGLRIRQMTPFGNMHVKITVDPREDRELEVFAQLGKGGDVANSDLEAVCRMISLWLRAGGSLRHVVKQLEGIGSSLQIPTRAGRIMSLGDGLAGALKKYMRAKERFGLRALLLGEVDLAELDKPLSAPGALAAIDRPAPRGAGAGANASSNPCAASPARVSAPRDETNEPDCASSAGGGSAGSASMAFEPLDGAAMSADLIGGRLGDSDPVEMRNSAPWPAGAHAPGAANATASTTAVAPSPVAVSTVARSTAAVSSAAPSTDAAPSAANPHAAASKAARLQSAAESLTRSAEPVAPAAAGGGGGAGAAAARAVVRHYRHDVAQHYKIKCPECGGGLALQEGCRKCYACGWSAC